MSLAKKRICYFLSKSCGFLPNVVMFFIILLNIVNEFDCLSKNRLQKHYSTGGDTDEFCWFLCFTRCNKCCRQQQQKYSNCFEFFFFACNKSFYEKMLQTQQSDVGTRWKISCNCNKFSFLLQLHEKCCRVTVALLWNMNKTIFWWNPVT